LLDGLVGESATYQTFGVKDGVLWVHGSLVDGSVTQQPLSVGEGNVGRGCAVALVIGNDLDVVVLPHCHAAIGCSQVNAYSFDISGCHGRTT